MKTPGGVKSVGGSSGGHTRRRGARSDGVTHKDQQVKTGKVS